MVVLQHEESQSKGAQFLSKKNPGWKKNSKKMKKQTKLIKGNKDNLARGEEGEINLWQEMTVSVRGQWIKLWRFHQQRRTSILQSTEEEAEENALCNHDFAKKYQSQSPSKLQLEKDTVNVLNHSIDDDDEQSKCLVRGIVINNPSNPTAKSSD